MSAVSHTDDALHSVTGPKITASRRKFRRLWLFILVVLNFQFTLTFELTGAEQVRWYHVILPFIGLAMIGDLRKWKFDAPTIFFVISVFFNLIAYTRFGFNSYFMRLGFAILSYFLGCCLARRLPYNDLMDVFRKFIIFFFICEGLHDAYYIVSTGSFTLYGGKATFINGGTNSQATWLSIMSLVFLGTGNFLPVIMAIVFCQIYTSRTGLILGMIALTASLFGIFRNYSWTKKLLVVGGLVVCAGLGVVYMLQSGALGASRFNDPGAAANGDTSALGRMLFLMAGILLLRNNIFGYGMGNIMPRLYDMWSNVPIAKVNNMHNIYMAYALESSIFALIAFVGIIIAAIVRYNRVKDFSALFAMIFCYWIAGLFEFPGYEPHFWLILGLFFTYSTSATAESRKRAVAG
jgi:hypothetical protein